MHGILCIQGRRHQTFLKGRKLQRDLWVLPVHEVEEGSPWTGARGVVHQFFCSIEGTRLIDPALVKNSPVSQQEKTELRGLLGGLG